MVPKRALFLEAPQVEDVEAGVPREFKMDVVHLVKASCGRSSYSSFWQGLKDKKVNYVAVGNRRRLTWDFEAPFSMAVVRSVPVFKPNTHGMSP